MRPGHCDVVWRLDFFWGQKRCLDKVLVTETTATSSCGFQLVNVSISGGKKSCCKAMRGRTEQRWLFFSPLLSPTLGTTCEVPAPVQKLHHRLGRRSTPGTAVPRPLLSLPSRLYFNAPAILCDFRRAPGRAAHCGGTQLICPIFKWARVQGNIFRGKCFQTDLPLSTIKPNPSLFSATGHLLISNIFCLC